MAVFMVHLSGERTGETVAKLEERYPKPQHHRLSQFTYLVSGDSIPETLAEKIGIGGQDGTDGPTGVVFRLNAAYLGFENRAVWEWLGQAEKVSALELGQG